MSSNSRIDALDARLKDFVEQHIHGWSHADWNRLLETMSAEGYDVSDAPEVGLRLERAHILATLERLALPGIGPRRRERVADSFPSLWALRQADVDELAALPTLHRRLAEILHESLERRTGGF